MHELWTEKYYPKKDADFTGNSEVFSKSIEWAKNWVEGKKQPPLLIWGQSGSGKTCLSYMLAKRFGWDVVELNNSDLRSKNIIEKVVGAAVNNASFFGSKRLILLDEVDGLTRTDRGGASAIASIIKEAHNPIILTANDIFSNRNISNLRFVCKTFEFKKINYLSMANRLKEILVKESIPFDEEAVQELARNSSGDMRSAILDLQTVSLSGKIDFDSIKGIYSRERQQNVFSIMKSIFKGTSFSEVHEMRMKSDINNDLLFSWVDENIPRQYLDAEDIALSFDRLSRADIFKGRIYRKQYWGFLRYVSELMCEGVAMSKKKPYNSFVMYQFPLLLSVLSKTSGIRSMKKELGKKIGSKMHSSSRQIISKDLPFLKAIFSDKKNAINMAAAFGLDDAELAFLLDTKPDTKKVKSIIEAAEEIKIEHAKPKRIFGEAIEEVSEMTVQEQESDDNSGEEPKDELIGKQTTLF